MGLTPDLDVPGQGASRLRTPGGRWHDQLNAVGGYALLGTMGCWALAFRRAVAWRKLVWPTVIVAGFTLANGVFAPMVLPRTSAGLSQRFSVLLAVAWLGIVGSHLLRHHPVVRGAPPVAG